MLIGMVFGGFRSMMVCVQTVAVRYVSVMGALVMVAVLVMLGGCFVVLSCVFMMLRGFMMMVNVVFGHGILSRKRIVRLDELLITKT
jgi:hypothetical protein